MNVSSYCLDSQWLERIEAGQLTDMEIEQVAEHLERCPACAGRVQFLEGYKVPVGTDRGWGDLAELAGNPVVAGLMSRLRKLTDAATTASGAVTATPPPADTGNSLLEVLSPPQGPAELGRLGNFRVLRELNKGGMGVVFEAEDVLLERRVALKLIRPEFLRDEGFRQRFLREARAAAALHNDYVVPIYQVEEGPGCPYLAMPLLRGETLEARLERRKRMPISEVLRIGREIALGLAVAHEHGLVHRDIKPGNIFLEEIEQSGMRRAACGTEADPSPGKGKTQESGEATAISHVAVPSPQPGTTRAKILDFGLARPHGGNTSLTSGRQVLGTPAYMAPEQAEGKPVDGRSDLFSLGCVLYQMVTGRLPFPGNSTLEILRSLAVDRLTPPRRVNREVPRELSALIEQLLAKDPRQRPERAALVAQKLAGIENRLAQPKHLPLWSKLALAACLLLTFGGVSWYVSQWLAAQQVLRVETDEGTLVVKVNDPDLEIEVVQGDVVVRQKSTDRTFRLKVERGQVRVFEKGSPTALVTKAFQIQLGEKIPLDVTLEVAEKRKHRLRSPLDNLKPENIAPYEAGMAKLEDPKNFPAKLVAVLGDSRWMHWSVVRALAFDAQGTRLVGGGDDHRLVTWDVATGKAIRPPETLSWIRGVAAGPDGKKWYVANDGHIRVYDTQMKVLSEWPVHHQGAINCMALSPDGKKLATSSSDRTVKIWNVERETGTLIHVQQHGLPVFGLAFLPGGREIASGTCEGGHPDSPGLPRGVFIWDTATGKETVKLENPPSTAGFVIACSSDGKWTASGGNSDGTIHLWDAGTGKYVRKLHGHDQRVGSLAFSPDGKLLASGGEDSRVCCWETKGWVLKFRKEARANGVRALAFRRDGKALAAAPLQMPVWVLDPNTGEYLDSEQREASCLLTCVAVTDDGGKIVAAGGDGIIRLWDLQGSKLKLTARIPAHESPIRKVIFSPDRHFLASAGNDGKVKIWDAITGKLEKTLAADQGDVLGLAFSWDGKYLAAGGWRNKVRVWNTANWKGREIALGTNIMDLSFSRTALPGGLTLGVVGHGCEVHLLNPAKLEIGKTITTILDVGTCVQFGPRGDVLTVGGVDHIQPRRKIAGKVQLFAVPDCAERHTKLTGQVLSIDCAPNGDQVAFSTTNGRIHLWGPNSGKIQSWQAGPLYGAVFQVRFTPDGRHLVTANGNGTMYVYRLKQSVP